VVPRIYSVSLSEKPVDREMVDLVILCREYGVEDIEAVKRIYRSSYINLYRSSRYTSNTLAVLSLHIYMGNTNQVSRLKHYCAYMGVRPKTVKTLLGRLKETEIYRPPEWEALLRNLPLNLDEEECKTIGSFVGALSKKIDINMNILSACVYRTTNLSLRKVARAFYISRQTVLKYNKKLEEII
tara:strand:+ start:17749 stop:18300 length:552 start_codon:yes stop_codon:yes gene_type:complete